MAITKDLVSGEALSDPQGFFRRLAGGERVAWNARWGGWLVTHHADVIAVLSDARFSAEAFKRFEKTLSDSDRARWPSVLSITTTGMVYRDPPDHTRLRSLVGKAFTRRTVDGLRERIAGAVEALLDRACERGRVDLLRDFATPLPVTVICEMIGIPAEQHERMRELSSEAAPLVLGALADADRHDRAEAGVREMLGLFRELIKERRRSPRDDFASALIAARDNSELLTENELVGMCTLIMGAGHETTTNLIANSVVAPRPLRANEPRGGRAAGDGGPRAAPL